jgi:hypothetical protein
MAKLLLLLLLISSQAALAQGLQMGTKGNGADLTDEQRLESQNFIHQGMSDRKMEELCNNESDPNLKKACEDGEVGAFGFIPPAVGDGVVKAYTMIIGMLPGEVDVPAESQEANGGEDKMDDYCKYIAIGTEAIAMVMQTAAQSNLGDIEPDNPNAQTEALYQSKRSMEERAKNAEFQTFGWGATSLCYGMMMVNIWTKGFNSWTIIAKFAGSALVTVYQVGVMMTNREYANKLGIIIAKMPKPGDCNPHTQRQCFCSQPETEKDPTYCMPPGIARTPAGANFTKVACLDRKMKPDPACQCAMSNDCFDITHMSMVNGISFGEGAQEAMFDPMKQIARGTIPTTNLGSGDLGNRAARKVKDLLNKYDQKLSPFSSLLNSNSQAQAKELAAFGLTKNAAIAVAVQRRSDPKFKSNLAAISAPSQVYAKANTRGVTSGFFKATGGTGFGNKASSSGDRENPMAKLFDKNKKGEAQGVTSKIIGLAEKAEQNAGISQHTEVDIFQIISRRYQLSGWKRVEFEQLQSE